MGKKKVVNARTKQDSTQPWDAVRGQCPECGSPIHMFIPPERSIGGAVAYPALLVHYENEHTSYSAGKPVGWSTPPPPPEVDELTSDSESGLMKKTGKKVSETWESQPPAPDEWVPVNTRRAETNQPQDEGVWPPVRVVTERPGE